MIYTRGETRTLTPKVLVPKTSASTNSATLALSKGWMMGLEPTTTGTTTQGSNQLSYTHHKSILSRFSRLEGLEPPTPSFVAMYSNPTELQAQIRGDRIRTYDLLVPNQPRYQAALHPVNYE